MAVGVPKFTPLPAERVECSCGSDVEAALNAVAGGQKDALLRYREKEAAEQDIVIKLTKTKLSKNDRK